ncbi:MAG: sporulation transcriptional regulator SpoIIID [Clostridia bacterium]|nr:sporulation transcriptional regulator SpoIIID [Clostridia bacterium]
MKDYIEERASQFASYIIENRTTIRDTAKKFSISKSTVHKDIVERLPRVNMGLAIAVRAILDENKSERHIRGGNATKLKYMTEKKTG